jgi:predicted PurR-regulated permease PerM
MVAAVPLRLLATIAVGAVLYFGHAAFIPIALALLFWLVLTTPVEALHRRGVPRSAAAVLILLVVIALLGGSVNLIWAPAQKWWVSAPATLHTIERKLRPLSRIMGRVEMLTNRAGQIASAPAVRPAAAPAAPADSTALTLLDVTRTALLSTVAVLVVTLFLLANGPAVLARMSAALAGDLQSAHMLKLIEAVRHEVGRYYGSIALINIGLGLATAAVTELLGMPNALLWGAIAGLLNFLPYVGSAITLLLLTIVAFVSFRNIGHVLAVPACYIGLATIEGQVVQPLVVGRRLELNPIIVFLALWFAGWFWGIAGVVMAIPTLVSLKVIAEHSRGGRPLQEFLSPNALSRYHPRQVSAAFWQRGRKPPP